MKKNKKIYILYTLIFVVFSLIAFYPFYSQGKSFIYNGDGYSQHYKALYYYSDYLKQIINNLITNHKLVIPQWNFSIGEGGGIVETFHYYVIGDPIAFLSIFVPQAYIYVFYNISVVLRIYLSGLCFIYLCRYFKFDNNYALLSGAFSYAFCFWSVFNANRHIYFLNPMIYLPLIIVGSEKIIHNENPLLFTIMVCISALSNFYFFYNIVILTVIYVLFRLITLYKKDLKGLFISLLKIAKYAIIGVLMAAVILLPIIFVFLNDSRVNTHNTYRFYYPFIYYLKLVFSLFSTTRNEWLCLGYSCPVVLAMIVSYFKWKDNILECIILTIGVIFIICPFFGQILNGFSYISNKWCFGFALISSYTLVKQWDVIKEYNLFLIIAFSVFGVALFIADAFHLNMIVAVFSAIAFTLICNYEKHKSKTIMSQSLLTFIAISGALFIALYDYTELGNHYSSVSTTYAQDYNMLETSEASVVDDFSDNEFFRYSGSNLTQNAALVNNTHSTDYYWSLTNSYTSKYRNDLNMSEYSLYKFFEYDQRGALYTLANVKYYLTNSDYNGLIPYNFEFNNTVDNYNIYINKSYLPFGYTYSDSISYETWQNLTAIEKEEALTKYAVIDENDTNIPVLQSRGINYKIIQNDNIEISDGLINVKQDNVSITLEFDINNNEGLYVTLHNVSFDDNKKWISNKLTDSVIYLSNESGITKEITVGTNDYRYNNGRNTFSTYLGCDYDGTTQITLTFLYKGSYTIENISVDVMPLDNYAINLNKLKQDILEEVVFDTNTVCGHIELQENKYLLLAIPYSKGWKAYVDGNEVDLINANDGYMALNLEKGEHDIKLEFSTPLLKEGFIISVIGCILLITDLFYIKHKKKQ